MDVLLSMFDLGTPPEGQEWMLYAVKFFVMAFVLTFFCRWLKTLTRSIMSKKL